MHLSPEQHPGRAGEKGLLYINLINIRDYSSDKHSKADDTPFGGGPGMVMMAQPLFDAIRSLAVPEEAGLDTPAPAGRRPAGRRMIYMSPRGRLLDAALIRELAAEEELCLLCGHYEGVDQRVLDYWQFEEVSIGDYILTGGELAAMVLIDAVARFIPEVLGSSESVEDESVYSGLLECDQYTKPAATRAWRCRGADQRQSKRDRAVAVRKFSRPHPKPPAGPAAGISGKRT